MSRCVSVSQAYGETGSVAREAAPSSAQPQRSTSKELEGAEQRREAQSRGGCCYLAARSSCMQGRGDSEIGTCGTGAPWTAAACLPHRSHSAPGQAGTQ
eukprot:2092141-Rhodomonas_salina.1